MRPVWKWCHLFPPIADAHVDRTETNIWQISEVLELFYIIGEMHQRGIGRVCGSKTGLVII